MKNKILITLLSIFLSIFSSVQINSLDIIEDVLKDMTLDEKIGQLFIIRLEALDPDYVSDIASGDIISHQSLTSEMIETYKKYPCGGITLFSRNIVNKIQLKDLTSDIHNLNIISPLICIDEEGGNVTRIASNKNFDVEKFPTNEEIANEYDPSYACYEASTISSYLKEYGIDVDFAPVSDINTNLNNKVIGKRAFGSDPNIASEYIVNYINGLHANNIASCIKHFPGHGDTSNDSHADLVYTYKTWEELLDEELITFKSGIDNNTDMVMLGHISTPNVTNNDLPASLSSEIISKLRNELNYNGIIITDSFEMGAISKHYLSKQAAVLAIKAGVDIILMPENYIEAYDGVKEAVLNNEISIERINESVRRILSLKIKTDTIQDTNIINPDVSTFATKKKKAK